MIGYEHHTEYDYILRHRFGVEMVVSIERYKRYVTVRVLVFVGFVDGVSVSGR